MKLYTFKPKKNAAQAMVEFAIVLPLLLLLLYGLLEAGRLLFIYSTIVTASRQAARYGSATGEGINPGVWRYQDCAGIRVAANRVDFLNAFNEYDVIIQHDHGPGGPAPEYYCTNVFGAPPDPNLPLEPTDTSFTPANNDERIIVTVVGDYHPIVPKIVPFLERTVANGNPIRAVSARTILTGVPIEVTPPPGSGPGPSPTGLTLSVAADPTTYTAAGQTINFTFTLQNTGSADMPGAFTITYDVNGVAGSVTCPDVTLAPGATATCPPAPYTVQPTDVPSDLTLNAIANNGTTSSNPASVTVKFAPQPALTLAKSASTEYATTGGSIVYTFTVTNSGNVNLTGPYAILDNLATATCPASGDLPVGASFTCTASYTVTSNDVRSDTLVNTATATAMYGTQTVTSPPSSASVYTGPLYFRASVSPTSVSVPTTVTYTYEIINNTGVTLYAPYTLYGFRGTENCSSNPGSLPMGASFTCTGTYPVTQQDLDSQTALNNTVYVEACNVDNNCNNQSKKSQSYHDSVSVSLVQTPALSMQLTAAPNPATTLNTPITYTYTVANTGNVTLSTLGITDNKITGITCPASLAPGAVQNCTATYTVTQADLDAGSIINQAAATATFMSNPVSSAPQSFTILTYMGPRIGLKITPNPTTFNGVGQFIVYTYTITNTGSDILYGPYSIVDTKVPSVNIDCVPAAGSLAVGASTTCVGTYATTQVDLDANYINSSATVMASNGAQTIPSTAATATVQTPWAPPPPVTGCGNIAVVNPPGITITNGSNNSTMSTDFTNPNSYSVTVLNVQVTWNRTGGQGGNNILTLQSASLNSTQFYTGSDNSGSLMITPNTNTSLTIPGNNSKSTIVFNFDKRYITRGSPSITINLSTPGCEGTPIKSP